MKNKSSTVRREIVPACASSAQWREHHREKVARRLLPKAAKVSKAKKLNSRNGHVKDADVVPTAVVSHSTGEKTKPAAKSSRKRKPKR